MATETTAGYPANLTVDFPEQPLNRVTTFFRLITMLPILFLLSTVDGAVWSTCGWLRHVSIHTNSVVYVAVGAGGLLVFGPFLMILFRKKYPRPWFDWNLALLSFSTRVSAYALLLTDQYPSTESEQAVHVELNHPDNPNRWLPIVKWLLAIPHYIVLFLLHIGTVVCVIIAWFAILITGRYPKLLFNYVVGVQRWSIRVLAYAILLTTDTYPPFRLSV